MLNVNERASGRQAVIAQWMLRAINLHGVRVEVRFRGNLLHILCEGPQAPDSVVVMSRVVEALTQADLAALLPPDPHPIYQIFLYGRGFGSDRPSWSEPIYLNQLDRHLEQLKHLQPPPPDLSSFSLHQPPARSHAGSTVAAVKTNSSASRKFTRSPSTPAAATRSKAPATSAPVGPTPARATTTASAALLVPNRTLAKQGKPEAIARYLSETLGAMGVAVEVTAKSLPCTPDATTDSQHRNRRLWIICEAPYSPDPATLAEPIAQKLRDLELDRFRDALVFSQVSGEPRPDWRLRVDLTPPDEMLKEWARWGDVQAIARLLNQPLAADKVQVEAELKESTLHLVCSVTANAATSASSSEAPVDAVPSQAAVVTTVSALLEALAPQGIHAVTLYGQVAGQEAPAWVDWLNLPAAQHGALAESAIALAQQGDRPALQFLLSRLLNPNLDWRLATGGVRIQILDREDLLHIMSDAPVCPKQKQVGPTVAKFLRQLKIPNVAGIRVYGRRAGQKRPLWSYGADFATRDRLVPEATPEFAASDAYVNELLTQPNEIALRPELTPEAVQAALSQTTQRITQRLQQILLRSQLFLPSDQPTGQQIGYKGAAVALVWGILGLLLTLQTDWVLGQILQVKTDLASVDARPKTIANRGSTNGVAVNPSNKPRPPLAVPEAPTSLKKSQGDDKTAFNASGFTESIPPVESLVDETSAAPKPLPAEPLKATATSIAVLAAARSPYATFNSRQLDEKLALYYQRLAESGPPDVLIIGSSRALRGVDPAALQKALAAQGYPGLSVFNFGVNGATAQVVDVILRQVLTPDQMPKLIVWADGARAFNSGRVDITYNAIAVSEGYRQVLAGTVPDAPNAVASPAATTVATSNLSAATPAGTPSDTNQAVGTSLAASYQALNQWMNASLGTFSATYAQRDQLKQLLQQQWAGVLKPKPSLEQLLATQGQFGAKSATPSGEGADSDSLLYAIDFDGFLPLSLRFNPATYYQKYAKVTGDYDSDYESFALKGKQMKALESLVQFTQAKQVPLVFVNLPLTKDYLDAVRMEHEEEFRQQMVQLATENSFVFRDLSQLWPTENDYFSDPSHLNRYGAYEVSNRLAQDPLIPWPRSQTSVSNTP